MQPILGTRCWICSKSPTKVLWYEDTGIKCHELCEKHYRFYSNRLRISGESKEQVEALVVTEYLTYAK